MNREKRLENVIKKVMRIWLTWGGHMKNWQRDQMSRKWSVKGGEEDRNCDGDSIKVDLDRMGEEWRNEIEQ